MFPTPERHPTGSTGGLRERCGIQTAVFQGFLEVPSPVAGEEIPAFTLKTRGLRARSLHRVPADGAGFPEIDAAWGAIFGVWSAINVPVGGRAAA
jgi:hypothetical protein